MSVKSIRVNPDSSPSAGDGLELVSIDIRRIKPYEHNPRRTVNAEYDRIKASIRADGLGQPLVITQRPGETEYMVHAGGNTRLRILKELFAETGDPRFGVVVCVIRAWARESDVLLAHLKENDLRGALTFLDKALAVADAKRFLEEEAGHRDLSQSLLAELLGARGYSLSQGLISQMAYVVDRLLPWLPQALEGGIGRPQVARIRALDRTARALWLERSIDNETDYDQVFEALCRRYDTPDWDIANLRRALEAEIAERADLSIHAVSLEFDARLAGRSVAQKNLQCGSRNDESEADEFAAESGGDTDTAGERRTPVSTREQSSLLDVGQTSSTPAAFPVVLNDGNDPGAADEDETEQDGAAGDVIAIQGTPTRTDVKSLRARLWTLATRLAKRNGLGDLIEPLSSKGLGFVLRDVPDPALIDQLDEDALAQVSMVWWHLAACAEITVAPLEALLPALPEESVLRRALEEQDAGLLFASVWTLDPGHTGYRLWGRLDDCDWQDLLGLMDAYRSLRRTTEADDHNLWGSAP